MPRIGTGGALAAAARPALEFRPIETVAALDQALAEAREAHKPVMLTSRPR